jgi:hypothetical protein
MSTVPQLMYWGVWFTFSTGGSGRAYGTITESKVNTALYLCMRAYCPKTTVSASECIVRVLTEYTAPVVLSVCCMYEWY